MSVGFEKSMPLNIRTFQDVEIALRRTNDNMDKIIDFLKRIDTVVARTNTRFYVKDDSGNKIGSVDVSGNLRLKASVYENQLSV